MNDNIYKITEVIGTSEVSIAEAIRNAVERTCRTVKDVGWFEVVETRGHVADGKVAHFQVTVKIGFHLRD